MTDERMALLELVEKGADADLVVYDPNHRGTISAATHSMAVDYSAFEGWPIEGRPSIVTVRGEVAVRDGMFVGRLGRGQFLPRKPGHFAPSPFSPTRSAR